MKFAFFCSGSFFNQDDNKQMNKMNMTSTNKNSAGMCLMDSMYLSIYCDNGNSYVSSMECLMANVWSTQLGFLLEKEPSNSFITSDTIHMPSLFSLIHPLDEMSPVLIKMNDMTGYFTESDYKMLFASDETFLLMLMDTSCNSHCIFKLSHATEDEIDFVGSNELNLTTLNATNNSSGYYNVTPQSIYKKKLLSKQSTNKINSTVSSQLEKMFHTNNDTSNATLNRPHISATHLNRLQSTFSESISLQDVRKIEQNDTSKPMIPELCLEQLWVDNNLEVPNLNDIGSAGFIHTDLIGHTYLGYLLKKTYKLCLVKVDKFDQANPNVIGKISNDMPAKDVVCLKKMNMMVVLAPCGTVMLYSGYNLIGKVHVAGILSSFITSNSINTSLTSPFPRSSSLLPTVSIQQESSSFDDELHMLSPVQPLPSKYMHLNNCQQMRDPIGNKITLVFADDKMFRMCLPLMTECQLVSKCLITLTSILSTDVAHSVLMKWYATSNVPGSYDFCREKEWLTLTKFLLQLFGSSHIDNEINCNQLTSAEMPKKRRKSKTCLGTNDDWEYVCNYSMNTSNEKPIEENGYNSEALLFTFMFEIFYTFHLLYEDMKLDCTLQNDVKLLAEFLYQIALDLKLVKYQLHYFLDFPDLLHKMSAIYMANNDLHKMNKLISSHQTVPNMFEYFYNMMSKPNDYHEIYPCIYNINNQSRNMIAIISFLYRTRCLNEFMKSYFTNVIEFIYDNDFELDTEKTIAKMTIDILLKKNLTSNKIASLPVSINYAMCQYLEMCSMFPMNENNPNVFNLLLSSELHANSIYGSYNNIKGVKENSLSSINSKKSACLFKSEIKTEENGMEDTDTKLLKLSFPNDLRVKDVQTFLNSSQPALIDIKQAPNISDHEFMEEQEKQLYSLCTSTMALPMGRGMFTLRTMTPTSTQSLTVPKLCLTGKEMHSGATIEIQQIEIPANMNMWPNFHNGVAAGLKMCPESLDMDSTWITYNKPKGMSEMTTEHAGFLMALGLNEHLKKLSFMSIYEYLVKCDEITSLGLLLGISAAHSGTMDAKTTKMLSVHMEALLPPTAVELDMPQNTQIAALMGIGLVYQGTAKRHIAEVLLQEIGSPPGPEMENYVESESYSLTAGIALGLVGLGQGEKSTSLSDLAIPDTLHYYMIGGNKRPLSGSQKEKYKLPSFQIKEGEAVNLDITAPGATLALGLMYFGSKNQAMSNWMKPPDTTYLLDLMRPDLLLLSILAKNLVMWDDIECTTEWAYNQVPCSLTDMIKKRSQQGDNFQTMDHEAQCQAYCNMMCGAAMSIGLRYTGTADETAFDTLYQILNYFLNISGNQVGEFAGKQTIENCMMMVLLSLSLVFVGTGDIRMLSCIRMLRSSMGPANNHVTYGSHMAVHMALGFLFLGAGSFTLSRTPEAIAVLICSIFPKFPTHSNDNSYHLQAFSHLYVLAIEPSLFLPRDMDTGQLSVCEISYQTKNYSNSVKTLAPCMLPELDTLKFIKMIDDSFWPMYYDKNNWNSLSNILKLCECVNMKKSAGCLSYMEDPKSLKSLLTQTLTTDKYNAWKIDPKMLLEFSNSYQIKNHMQKYLLATENSIIESFKTTQMSDEEQELMQLLILQTCFSLTYDKMHGLSVYISLVNFISNMNTVTTYDIWQFGMLESILDRQKPSTPNNWMLSVDMLHSLIYKMKSVMDGIRNKNMYMLHKCIKSDLRELSNVCSATLNELTKMMMFYKLEFIFNMDLNMLENDKEMNMIFVKKLSEYNIDLKAIECVMSILSGKL
uniref:Putative anaphase-promoting complex apc subunit 1 meiotic check point regulator/tsg24 n=1 Tax=Corethrella appendiculata TaxID=1370023 RepID=W4VRH0_9DIPT